MKKLLALLTVAFALAGSASAALYTDVNHANVLLDSNSGPWWAPNPFYNPSYNGTFTLPSYNPAVEHIVSANVTFDLWDASFLDNESYQVTLDNVVLGGGSFFWNVSFAGGVVGAALLDLSADGVLSYTVTATSGSFWLNTATIRATSAVPDQGITIALLGVSLLGLAAVRRKLSA